MRRILEKGAASKQADLEAWETVVRICHFYKAVGPFRRSEGMQVRIGSQYVFIA